MADPLRRAGRTDPRRPAARRVHPRRAPHRRPGVEPAVDPSRLPRRPDRVPRETSGLRPLADVEHAEAKTLIESEGGRERQSGTSSAAATRDQPTNDKGAAGEIDASLNAPARLSSAPVIGGPGKYSSDVTPSWRAAGFLRCG